MISVLIQQPALPLYRVPVFRELASRPGLRVRVAYGDCPAIESVETDAFPTQRVPIAPVPGTGRRLMHHTPQLHPERFGPCDVLVLSWNSRFVGLGPALLKARRRRVGTVLWGHGYSKSERRWARAIRNGLARRADSVLTYNVSAGESLEAEGFPGSRLFTAPNAIAQDRVREQRDRFAADPEALRRFQQAEGIDPTQTLVFVSRLDPANRLDLLLESVAQLRAEFPRLRLVVIGSGDAESERLRSIAERLEVSDRVRFEGPIYEEERLAPWMLSSTVFCYPANIGLSVLHAFGYGLPVITSNRSASQNPEIESLRPGDNGLTYVDGNAADLAASIRRLLNEPTERAWLSAAALRTAHDEYTIPRMVDGMEAAIRSAFNRARARAS